MSRSLTQSQSTSDYTRLPLQDETDIELEYKRFDKLRSTPESYVASHVTLLKDLSIVITISSFLVAILFLFLFYGMPLMSVVSHTDVNVSFFNASSSDLRSSDYTVRYIL